MSEPEVTRDTLVKDLREAAHAISQYDPEDTATGQLLAKAAARIEQLEAALEAAGKLAQALDTIANGAELGEQLFDARMGEHKDRLTWHAVNVLQDNIAACVGHARTALQAWETRHDL